MTGTARIPSLRVWQALWFALTLASITVFVLGVPAQYIRLSNPPAAVLRSVTRSGLSLEFYVDYLTVSAALFGLLFLSLGILIAYRRFHDPMGLMTSAFLALWAGGSPPISQPLGVVFPQFAIVANSMQFLMTLGLALFLFVFPDGHVFPRWAARPLLAASAITIAFFLLTGATQNSNAQLLTLVLSILALASQWYRYRRLSTPLQQQQTKWVLIGLSFAIAIEIPFIFFNFPTIGIAGTAYDLSSTTVLSLAFGALPVTIAIAILRYKLWEIDTLINRALVYGSLTVSLAGLYIGGVVGVEAALRTVTGQTSQLAVAVVTLAVAALFNPWRRSLQTFIDRRFYRHKYDAARTLAMFQTRLRDEVDLDQLTADLVAVVENTVQPASVALWLPSRARP